MTRLIQPSVLAGLAAAAYTSPASFAVGDVHAVVTAEGDVDVVAFRGSIEAADWLRDAEFVPLYDPRVGSCHAGFLTGARAILPLLRNACALAPERPKLFVGHSLGGALALVAGGLLVETGLAPVHIETYGAPRPGFMTLARVLSGVSVDQYRRGNDPVPELPLPPFEHVRAPLIAIGDHRPLALAIECHAIAGYQVDLAALEAAS